MRWTSKDTIRLRASLADAFIVLLEELPGGHAMHCIGKADVSTGRPIDRELQIASIPTNGRLNRRGRGADKSHRSRERDPHRILRNWGTLVTEVGPRTAPILLLVRDAAATDAEIASLLEEVDRTRLARMEHKARTLHDRGALRPDVTLEQARDVLWAYSSPELYELLVVRRRWPIDRYGQFVAEGMIAALLHGSGEPEASTSGHR